MRPIRPIAALAGVVLLVAACGSSGASPSGLSGEPASAAASQAATAPATSSASSAPSASASSPASMAPTDGASAAPSTAGGGMPANIPYGKNVCDILPDATINSTLGIHVKSHGWDGHVCSWYSTSPAGGATIGWVKPGDPMLAGAVSGCLAPSTPVDGIGLDACGMLQTGLPAPLPPSSVLMVVDLGSQGGMTVHVSGKDVTIDQAVVLGNDVLNGG